MRTTPGMPAQAALDARPRVLEVGVAVGLHDEVRVQRQHLVLELALEAARHAEHDDQRRDAQHDAHRRHRREHREDAQQERHHRHQPARQDADDARGLDSGADAAVRQREQRTKPTTTSASPATQRRPRPARPPPAVQVAEARRSARAPVRTARRADPAERDRDGDRSQRQSGRPARERPPPPQCQRRGREQDRRVAGAERMTAKSGSRPERHRDAWRAQPGQTLRSSFLDTLRRQTVPYTAMAFSRARRLPLLLCAVAGRRACSGRRSRARGQERSAAAQSLPDRRRSGCAAPSAAGSTRDGSVARRHGRRPTPTAQSRFRSLMSELGVAIAPRLMTPADTLGYAGLPVLRRARRHQDQPEPEGRRRRRRTGTASPASSRPTRPPRARLRT